MILYLKDGRKALIFYIKQWTRRTRTTRRTRERIQPKAQFKVCLEKLLIIVKSPLLSWELSYQYCYHDRSCLPYPSFCISAAFRTLICVN